LKSSFDTSRLTEQPVSDATRVVIAALQKYGMFLADGVSLKKTVEKGKRKKEKIKGHNTSLRGEQPVLMLPKWLLLPSRNVECYWPIGQVKKNENGECKSAKKGYI
jgi:hypothetical protein